MRADPFLLDLGQFCFDLAERFGFGGGQWFPPVGDAEDILIFERGLSLTLKRKLIEIFDMIPVFEKALRLALQKKLHETLQTILVFERALKFNL